MGFMVITELWMITRGARDEGEEQEAGIHRCRDFHKSCLATLMQY